MKTHKNHLRLLILLLLVLLACVGYMTVRCYYKRICSVDKTYLEYACNADPVSQKKLVFLFHLR